jgi:hypothetical protein
MAKVSSEKRDVTRSSRRCAPGSVMPMKTASCSSLMAPKLVRLRITLDITQEQ